TCPDALRTSAHTQNNVPTYTLDKRVSFFHAEVGIRDSSVTGVQTCALPIFQGSSSLCPSPFNCITRNIILSFCHSSSFLLPLFFPSSTLRSFPLSLFHSSFLLLLFFSFFTLLSFFHSSFLLLLFFSFFALL